MSAADPFAVSIPPPIWPKPVGRCRPTLAGIVVLLFANYRLFHRNGLGNNSTSGSVERKLPTPGQFALGRSAPFALRPASIPASNSTSAACIASKPWGTGSATSVQTVLTCRAEDKQLQFRELENFDFSTSPAFPESAGLLLPSGVYLLENRHFARVPTRSSPQQGTASLLSVLLHWLAPEFSIEIAAGTFDPLPTLRLLTRQALLPQRPELRASTVSHQIGTRTP